MRLEQDFVFCGAGAAPFLLQSNYGVACFAVRGVPVELRAPTFGPIPCIMHDIAREPQSPIELKGVVGGGVVEIKGAFLTLCLGRRASRRGGWHRGCE